MDRYQVDEIQTAGGMRFAIRDTAKRQYLGEKYDDGVMTRAAITFYDQGSARIIANELNGLDSISRI